VTESEKVGSGGDLERVLADLRALSGDIASCAVLAGEGALLSSSHAPGVERERVAAMLAAVANLAERAARESGKGHASQVRVDTEGGHLLLVRLAGGGFMAATTAAEARVGLVLYDMRNARGAVEKAVQGGDQA
jgi:predicted regulator of Ras-like GTPase activity (Roadblock/LC7/MglB family)